MVHKELIERICAESDCHRDSGYCILREILYYKNKDLEIPETTTCHEGGHCVLKDKVLEADLPDKLIVQLKCLEIFKYEESASCGKDIGWVETNRLWAKRKHADRFSEFYKDGCNPRELYEKVTKDYAIA